MLCNVCWQYWGPLQGTRTWLDTLLAIGLTLIGGTLSAGGSNAINMWYDADIDPHMRRTQHRPIPRGDVKPSTALVFGITISLLGSSLFFIGHWKAAFWSFFSVLFYVFIYSIWLKRRTPQNIVIGGVAGSTPPLIGWIVASSATIPDNMNPFDLGSPIPWILFLLIFQVQAWEKKYIPIYQPSVKEVAEKTEDFPTVWAKPMPHNG